MSKKLKVRKLSLSKLPYGKFKWIGFLKNHYRDAENGSLIQPIRELLDSNAMGHWKFDYYKNYRNNKVYTKIYTVEKIDMALIKLCHSELLTKIFQVELTEQPE